MRLRLQATASQHVSTSSDWILAHARKSKPHKSGPTSGEGTNSRKLIDLELEWGARTLIVYSKASIDSSGQLSKSVSPQFASFRHFDSLTGLLMLVFEYAINKGNHCHRLLCSPVELFQ